MRIPIREQLGLLILLSSLIGLMVVSVATWISNHSFVLSIRSSRLSLTASLKAAQLASNLNLMQTSASFVSTRVLIQSALQRYNDQANNSAENWTKAQSDMLDAISGRGSVGQAMLLQSMVFPKNASGPVGSESVMNTTSTTLGDPIRLPYNCPDGAAAYLGDGTCGNLNLGYPPMLYPNLTYASEYYDSTNVQEAVYAGDTLRPGSALLIGPLAVNNTFSLVSMTMPIINNTSAVDVLGWLTVVMDAGLIQDVVSSTQGLDQTGQTLLVGPTTLSNMFAPDVLYNTRTSGSAPTDFQVQYVLPINSSAASRHPDHVLGTANAPFSAAEYPAIVTALTQDNHQQDNSGALVQTRNEAGKEVSVGFAIPQQNIVDWVVLVEQARSEVWQPIYRLRNILLACVFATAALMAIIAFPLAHFFSLPIRRLREATARSIEPPGVTPSRSSMESFRSELDGPRNLSGDGEEETGVDAALAHKEGYKNPVSKWQQRRREEREKRREDRRKRAFKIPGKVKERKSFLKDELTDLTGTFNEMSDELMMQYDRLEERVQQRTAELELSKKAAEAANESKTLFIANISHELKTPLNGILGMAAVCLQEDDPTRLKRSLGIIYKSGDLLLNLLTDLLTFSKNQVGQHLTLDEKEFKLREISSQILAIFDKQAKEGNIDLRVEYEGVHGIEDDSRSPERRDIGYGPSGTGRVKNMILWGDVHRILQVVINLVSNALKFTPGGGSVVVTVRCLPEMPEMGSRKSSMNSRQSRQHSSRHATHKGSDASLAVARHSRRQTDDHDGAATPNADAIASGSGSPVVAPTESQPRLVGLSQPFFAASSPMESPGSQPAAMQKITAEATRGGRIRVLVAEDNKVNQEVVLRMLKLEDIYDVTVAKDGQEALDRVRESMQPRDANGGGGGGQPYNLIFMDVQMPNVDGLTSTKMIREIGYQAPIVALTAFAEESNIKDCYDSGMNYFLSKPIRRPQLKKVLKEYCAPIPEEDEVTPPEPVQSGGNTTIIMVNSPKPEGSVEEQTPATAVTGKSPPSQVAEPSGVKQVKERERGGGAGSEPVSPFSA
ncbi:Histidine kinase osmosensor [Friedmanniomyces endolithicus]|uniref:Histidine kinase osmosensor n=1 Tax=Rachicladosporium monterosium TaxID=1507873 RepID=A0ABR0L4H3_9PEZI|nr:Histidine kinase osmosensor [Friedmanniomyces endolithicus]KAK5142831.1 Histidine kinase osmosensor [Rachicladosporium monterosium]